MRIQLDRSRCLAVLLLAAYTACAAGCARDATLAHDVRSRLIIDDTTNELELTVTVERGVVRLAGVTRTQRKRARALEIAQEVAGSGHVIDEMRLDEHPLAAAVRAAVEQDPALAAIPVEIDADDYGVVVLRSVQTNAAQRERLVQIARHLPGVTAVDDEMK
jgi:osmotically-inducible protein OsmY